MTITLFVGLDISQKDIAVSVVDDTGRQVWRGKVRTEPQATADVVALRAPEAATVGLETGPLSTWLWHALRELRVPVICMDAATPKPDWRCRSTKPTRTTRWVWRSLFARDDIAR